MGGEREEKERARNKSDRERVKKLAISTPYAQNVHEIFWAFLGDIS